ncbi:MULTISPECIES: peptidylprolyl isomerase [unclassified Acidovorax]|uniref:peptidylprolyl isomerase n=1 Tax=unclassified Acidovorax TaxID=2684926 RepID=UPI002882DB89|nr:MULTISPECIES: peptidylprolyl isomerase [unclassified Acidovorax]
MHDSKNSHTHFFRLSQKLVALAVLQIAVCANAQPVTGSAAQASGRSATTNDASMPAAALPSTSVLVRGSKATVTVGDVQADAAMRIPAENLDQVLSRSAAVSQIATNLYARRAMAADAEAAKLNELPAVAAALQVAKDRVLSDAWLAKIGDQNSISDAAAEGLALAAYKAKPERFVTREQIRVRHILFSGVTPESRAQAETALDELKKGADFGKLARESSADKGSGAKDGDLGFFERGRMVPAFEQAAFALTTPGELSGVVESQFGYHIIRFEERKLPGPQPFEDVRGELMKEARGTLLQEARVSEAQRLQQGMTVEKDAVSAFSATFKPTTVRIAP